MFFVTLLPVQNSYKKNHVCNSHKQEKPNVFALQFNTAHRVHSYVCGEVKQFIETVNRIMKDLISAPQLKVTEITEEQLMQMRDKKLYLGNDSVFLMKHTVEKIKSEMDSNTVVSIHNILCIFANICIYNSKVVSRKLHANSKYFAEVDGDSDHLLSLHPINDVCALIRYNDNENLFGVQFKHDSVCKYSSPERDIILLNLLEMISRNDIVVPISNEEVVEGVIEGPQAKLPSPDYGDYLLKKVASIEKESLEDAFKTLREFNMSYSCDEAPCKDKSVLKSLLTVLSRCDKEKVRSEDTATVLGAMFRCIYAKVVFEDVVNQKERLARLIEDSLADRNEGIRIMASATIAAMVDRYQKNEKGETQNQLTILTPETAPHFLEFVKKNYQKPKAIIAVNNILQLFRRTLESFYAEDLCKYLLQKVYDNRRIFYALCRSPSFTIAITATTLLNILNIRQPSNRYVYCMLI